MDRSSAANGTPPVSVRLGFGRGLRRVEPRRVAFAVGNFHQPTEIDRFRWVHILVANVPTMVLTAAQRAALTQILDTASDLNRWRLRAHRVEEPQRGSELGVDDL